MSRKIFVNEPGLIQDVAAREDASPERSGKVRHTATIGELDDAWQRQAASSYHGLGMLPHAVRRIPVEEETEASYDPALRVPPLSSLNTPWIEGRQFWPGQHIRVSAAAFWLAVTAFIGRYWDKMTSYVKSYLPKSYTLLQGTYTDWSTAMATGVKRVAIPLGAAAILLVAVLSLPGEQSPAPGTASPQTAQGHNPTVKVENTGKNSSGGSGTNTSNGTTTSPATTAPTASNGTTTSGTSSTGSNGTSIPITYYPQSGSTIGGKGGGDSTSTPTTGTQTPTTTSPSTGGIPGVTSPYPVTVPGQTLNLGDKQIISTSPITTTLN